MKSGKKPESEGHYMPMGMCLGIAVGTALGVAMDNLSVYMPMGLALGMCIGSFIDGSRRKKTGDAPDEGEEE